MTEVPGWAAQVLETEGSTGGSHAEQKDAVKHRPPCAIDPSRQIPENLHAQLLPTLLTHSPARGRTGNLDLPRPQDVRAAETEVTCRKQVHCRACLAPDGQQLLAYGFQDIPSQQDACF